MKSFFDENINEYYKSIECIYPKLIKSCDEVFSSDIKKLEKYLREQCNSSPDVLIDVVIDYVPDEASDLTKYAISKLILHLSSNTSIKKHKDNLRKFLLTKKRTYKTRYEKGEFSDFNIDDMDEQKEEEDSNISNDFSPEFIKNWLSNNEKLILSDFFYFDSMSNTIKIPHLLKTLEYILCDYIKINKTYNQFPSSTKTPFSMMYPSEDPKCEFDVSGLVNFYHDVITYEDEKIINVTRYYDAEGVRIDGINSKSSKEELAVICHNYKDYCFPFVADNDVYEINFHIFNMINSDWCAKQYIIYYIDDVIVKMDSSLGKKGLSNNERVAKTRLRNKILYVLNNMHKYRVLKFSIDKETGKTDKNDSISGAVIFQDSVILDKSKGLVKTTLSDNAISCWLQDKNDKVLQSDLEKIGSSISKQLIFYLQGLRVASRKDEYKCHLSISALKDALGSKSNETLYLKNIFKDFDELVLKSTIINKYSRKDNFLYFDFIPLSSNELKIYNLINE